MRHQLAVDSHVELRAGDRNQPRVLEHQFGPHQRDLNRRGVWMVAHQGIRKPMRIHVHRPAHRHSLGLEAPASEVLHRRQQASFHDANRSHAV